MAKKLYVCQGNGCKKHKSKSKSICSYLEGDVSIEEVRCQKICKGPVVGLKLSGKMQWFRKLDDQSDWESLRKALKKGRIPKSLAAKEARKRVGKLR